MILVYFWIAIINVPIDEGVMFNAYFWVAPAAEIVAAALPAAKAVARTAAAALDADAARSLILDTFQLPTAEHYSVRFRVWTGREGGAINDK